MTDKPWHTFAEGPPTFDGWIWIGFAQRADKNGVKPVALAQWQMDIEDPHWREHRPGISWSQPVLGTDQPTHWMRAEIPVLP